MGFEWKYPSKFQLPPDDLIVLCYGECLDKEASGGYFIARLKSNYEVPVWLRGRHQERVSVEKWCVIDPELFWGEESMECTVQEKSKSWMKYSLKRCS